MQAGRWRVVRTDRDHTFEETLCEDGWYVEGGTPILFDRRVQCKGVARAFEEIDSDREYEARLYC